MPPRRRQQSAGTRIVRLAATRRCDVGAVAPHATPDIQVTRFSPAGCSSEGAAVIAAHERRWRSITRRPGCS